MKRFSQNKNHGAKKFRRDSQRTKRANISPTPMRGGIRM